MADWFVPKAFGIGATPVTWQGWALTLGFAALVVPLAWALLPRHHALFVALVVILTIGFTAVTAQNTRGGWRWRWGGD